jgi:hypothetical protein
MRVGIPGLIMDYPPGREIFVPPWGDWAYVGFTIELDTVAHLLSEPLPNLHEYITSRGLFHSGEEVIQDESGGSTEYSLYVQRMLCPPARCDRPLVNRVVATMPHFLGMPKWRDECMEGATAVASTPWDYTNDMVYKVKNLGRQMITEAGCAGKPHDPYLLVPANTSRRPDRFGMLTLEEKASVCEWIQFEMSTQPTQLPVAARAVAQKCLVVT